MADEEDVKSRIEALLRDAIFRIRQGYEADIATLRARLSETEEDVQRQRNRYAEVARAVCPGRDISESREVAAIAANQRRLMNSDLISAARAVLQSSSRHEMPHGLEGVPVTVLRALALTLSELTGEPA